MATTLAKLKQMSDPQIQDWLRKVGFEHVDLLVIALTGADDEVQQCVLRNMSGPAAAALKMDLEQQKEVKINADVIKESVSELEAMM
jgi:flagellar motor switch protein FliG